MIGFFRRSKKSDVANRGERIPVQSEGVQLRAELASLQRRYDELQRNYDALYSLNQSQANMIDQHRGLREAISVG
jgi:hypothetical protein